MGTEAERATVPAFCTSKNAYDLQVTDILVEPGQSVKAEQLLITLEFYKVVTEIIAPFDGTVAAVLVSRGDEVQVGDPLVEIVRRS